MVNLNIKSEWHVPIVTIREQKPGMWKRKLKAEAVTFSEIGSGSGENKLSGSKSSLKKYVSGSGGGKNLLPSPFSLLWKFSIFFFD